MSESDLLRVTEELLDYIRGDRPEMDMRAVVDGQERAVFNEREITHMVDVRGLYAQAMRVRNICLGLWLLGLALLLARRGRQGPRLWARGFVNTVLGVLVVFALLGIVISKNFTTFWNNFHLVFFSNDLWILDPATDLMIVMFQEGFFFDMVTQILTVTAGALGCLLLLAVTVLRLGRRKRG
jgi:integral membrane protein (TIGR01906 family)